MPRFQGSLATIVGLEPVVPGQPPDDLRAERAGDPEGIHRCRARSARGLPGSDVGSARSRAHRPVSGAAADERPRASAYQIPDGVRGGDDGERGRHDREGPLFRIRLPWRSPLSACQLTDLAAVSPRHRDRDTPPATHPPTAASAKAASGEDPHARTGRKDRGRAPGQALDDAGAHEAGAHPRHSARAGLTI